MSSGQITVLRQPQKSSSMAFDLSLFPVSPTTGLYPHVPISLSATPSSAAVAQTTLSPPLLRLSISR